MDPCLCETELHQILALYSFWCQILPGEYAICIWPHSEPSNTNSRVTCQQQYTCCQSVSPATRNYRCQVPVFQYCCTRNLNLQFSDTMQTITYTLASHYVLMQETRVLCFVSRSLLELSVFLFLCGRIVGPTICI